MKYTQKVKFLKMVFEYRVKTKNFFVVYYYNDYQVFPGRTTLKFDEYLLYIENDLKILEKLKNEHIYSITIENDVFEKQKELLLKNGVVGTIKNYFSSEALDSI